MTSRKIGIEKVASEFDIFENRNQIKFKSKNGSKGIIHIFSRTYFFKTLSYNMVKHTQTICRQMPKKCFGVFDCFVESGLIGLIFLDFVNF